MVNGKAVKTRREKLKMTQHEAGLAVGWTAQRWSDFENGRNPDPRLSTLAAVARVLRCKLDVLVVSAPDSKADSVSGVQNVAKRKQA